MREIKFRAWNGVIEKMIDLKKITPLALNIDTDGLFIPESDGLKIMQYTGLKDRNGTEIYEGDIVSPISFYGSYRDAIVKFRDGCFIVESMDICKDYGCIGTKINMRIVGNIYENPELGG